MDERTANLLHAWVTAAFVGTWVIGLIAGLVASHRMGAAAKRRWMPFWMITFGILFVFFSTTLTVLSSRSWSSLNVLFIVIPAVVLISVLNIKHTKICDQCGATLFNHNWFQPMRFCSKCGAELDSTEGSTHDRLLE